MRVSTALYGLYVCHFAVYSDCAPVSLRKENVLVLRRCTGRLGLCAFSSTLGGLGKTMRIYILFTMLILFLFGCTVQPDQSQLPVGNTMVLTPSSSLDRKTEATSAATRTKSLTPISSRRLGNITSTATKAIASFPSEEFHFGATPANSQSGGINGVFYRDAGSDETCSYNYSVFRFYDDGLVMYVSVCDDESTGNFSRSVWPYISEWFSREKIDETISQGIYSIKENKIWFTTVAKYPSHTVVSDYLGTFSKDRMILDRYSHPNGYQIKEHEAREEYVWFDILNEP